MGLRIAIFDDNKNIRESISLLLKTQPDFEVVGSFSHVLDCVDDVKECQPDIVLMDIEMPGMSGIEAVLAIKKQLPHVQILMQTVFEDDDRVFDSICAGASGYILKNHLNNRLIDAIKELQFGGSPMSPSIARQVLNSFQQNNKSKHYQLSSREVEVLLLLIKGYSAKMIAGELSISFDTARFHLKNIYSKLHVNCGKEAIAKARAIAARLAGL